METMTMSVAEKNATLVRQGYQAFNNGDMKTLAELFNPNATWHSPGKSRIAGDFKGRDAVFTQFGRYGSETNGSFKAILKDIAICENGRIVGIHRNTAERSGKKLDIDCCIVFEMRDGLIVDGKEYIYDLHAWDSFWS